MELKYYLDNNWGDGYDSSNCTFMELKSLTITGRDKNIYCSNCTFMELKWEYAVIRAQQYLGSNCTFMELKYEKGWQEDAERYVLIVPLWN